MFREAGSLRGVDALTEVKIASCISGSTKLKLCYVSLKCSCECGSQLAAQLSVPRAPVAGHKNNSSVHCR